MKPSQIAQALRHIASKIQNSKQPDRRLVARDLKRILIAIAPPIAPYQGYPEDGWEVSTPLQLHFYVVPNSPLAIDVEEEEMGIKFTELLDNAGLTHVEWGPDNVSFVIPKSEKDPFSILCDNIEAGKHGPDMQKALASLESPGICNYWDDAKDEPVDIPDEDFEHREYYLS